MQTTNSDEEALALAQHSRFDVVVSDLNLGSTRDGIDILKAFRAGADAMTPVLIVGETGMGKELVARAIHPFGKVKERSFEALKCAVVPETLLASELFGHVKGVRHTEERPADGRAIRNRPRRSRQRDAQR